MSLNEASTRRRFLKTVGAAGLAGGGVYSVRDGVSRAASREAGTPRIKGRPFWVRQADEVTLGLGELTEDYKRWDPVNNCFARLPDYIGKDRYLKVTALGAENAGKGVAEKRPGWSVRDAALSNGGSLVNFSSGGMDGDSVGILKWNPTEWTEQFRAQHDKYDEPPGIAARDVKAAARLYGAALVGIAPLDRRLIFSHGPTPRHPDLDEFERAKVNGKPPSGKPIVFEDVERPYVTDEKYVIPDSFNRVVVLANRMSPETMYRVPSRIGGAASYFGYSAMSWTAGSVAEFIRSLGYEAIPLKNGFLMTVAYAVQSGLGELSRTNRLVTYEYGPMVRLSTVLTDLPMATDKPMDAGIAEFCRRCGKCAQACPAGAISFDRDPSWEVKGPWNNPGHKAWFLDAPKCLAYWRELNSSCSICFASCPWSKKDRSWAHSLVKMTAATTPAIGGLLRRMNDAFGYGPKNSPKEQEKWWELELPEYGIDTMQGKTEV